MIYWNKIELMFLIFETFINACRRHTRPKRCPYNYIYVYNFLYVYNLYVVGIDSFSLSYSYNVYGKENKYT